MAEQLAVVDTIEVQDVLASPVAEVVINAASPSGFMGWYRVYPDTSFSLVYPTIDQNCEGDTMTNEQLAAMRQALAALENTYALREDVIEAKDALRTAIEQAETAQGQEQKMRFKCTVIDEQHLNGVPLEQWGNAAQRQWVGLTEDEVDDIWNSYCDEMGEASINDAEDIYRAIEAKLKEKNQ